VNRDYVADGYHLLERAYGVFERSIALPPNADTATANASYRNGVLTVEFAKSKGRGNGRLKVV
jgi:HSP20 family protein